MYPFLRGIAVILIGGGAFCLVGHLIGQIRIGFASEISLIGGLIALIVGIISLALADLGSRLVRIEKKLGSSSEDDLLDQK